jgi:hypothetical protein
VGCAAAKNSLKAEHAEMSPEQGARDPSVRRVREDLATGRGERWDAYLTDGESPELVPLRGLRRAQIKVCLNEKGPAHVRL